MSSYQRHRYHIIFTTKNREPIIRPEIEQEVWAYLAGLGRVRNVKVYEVGGVDDHIHFFCGIPASMAVSQAVQEIKGASSHWMKTRFEDARMSWQSSYASFTVSPVLHDRTKAYIRNQRQHHQKISFDEEMKRIIALYDQTE